MAAICEISNISLLYTESPPFVVGTSDGVESGIVYDSYLAMISACCSDYRQINYQYQAFESDNSLLGSSQIDNSISMPIYVASQAMVARAPSSYIPVTQIDAFILLGVSSAAGDTLIQALVALWPIIVSIWGMSALCGYVLWFTETYISKDNSPFPRHFASGVFEGFWFALISGSTVGYGDYVARNVVSKLFMMLWLTVSALQFSTLTGTFTSLFNVASSTSVNLPPVAGSLIGVPANGIDKAAVLALGGNPVQQSTAEGLLNDLINGKTNAILVDPHAFLWLFSNVTDLWTTENIQATLVDYSLSIGLLLPNPSSSQLPQSLYNCLQERSFITQLKYAQLLTESANGGLIQYQQLTLEAVSSTMWSTEGIWLVVGLSCAVIVVIVLTYFFYFAAYKFSVRKKRFETALEIEVDVSHVHSNGAIHSATHIDMHENWTPAY